MRAKLGTEASGRSGGLGVAFSDLGAAAAAAVPKANLRRCRRYCPVSATATLARPAASGRVGCPHRQRTDFLSWYRIALRQQLSVIAPARCGRETILVAMPWPGHRQGHGKRLCTAVRWLAQRAARSTT